MIILKGFLLRAKGEFEQAVINYEIAKLFAEEHNNKVHAKKADDELRKLQSQLTDFREKNLEITDEFSNSQLQAMVNYLMEIREFLHQTSS